MTIKYPGDQIRKYYKPTKEGGKERVVKKKKRGPGPEHVIQDNIRIALTMRGHTVYRVNVGQVKMEDGRTFHSGVQKGFPDLCGFRKGDGKMFFIEVKTKQGKRSPAQVYFAREIASKPVIYGVARSAEEALEIVEKELNRTEDVK
ncbi:VRR-NUC domain-containing protein [Lactiplantibacillus daowaiensis]|uniref:VRR-NUC domain-containing protein n=1 Tax=Lactiplantibacillus daowaiensis TaxID=2559918 RepID=A0ABW1RXW3_9LACO|nr:VRR-NUC domain-containing protein [Lactiplantibacillus daowaiensis]